MPNYFHSGKLTERVKLRDGSHLGLPGRGIVFIDESWMSADLQKMINEKRLIFKGYTDAELTKMSAIVSDMLATPETQIPDKIIEMQGDIPQDNMPEQIASDTEHDRMTQNSAEDAVTTDDESPKKWRKRRQ